MVTDVAAGIVAPGWFHGPMDGSAYTRPTRPAVVASGRPIRRRRARCEDRWGRTAGAAGSSDSRAPTPVPPGRRSRVPSAITIQALCSSLQGPAPVKTTTIVEAVAARLGGPRPLAPDDVLVLTFGRAAARGTARPDSRATHVRLICRRSRPSTPLPGSSCVARGPRDTSASRLLSGLERDLAVAELGPR